MTETYAIGETVHFIEVRDMKIHVFSGVVADIDKQSRYHIQTCLDSDNLHWWTWRIRKTVFATNHDAYNYANRILNEGPGP